MSHVTRNKLIITGFLRFR